jgi:hypothetical protein
MLASRHTPYTGETGTSRISTSQADGKIGLRTAKLKIDAIISGYQPWRDDYIVGVRMRNMDACGMWTHAEWPDAVTCRMR